MEVLAALLVADPTPLACEGVLEFWARHLAAASQANAPVDRALLGGFSADRVGYAFIAGYEAALASLLGRGGVEGIVSLCATEQGGAHPRAIEARLEERQGSLHLQANKRWATLATVASELVVLASLGDDAAGRRRLALVRVAREAPGVRVAKMPDPPFAPEVPHAEVAFEDVVVAPDQLLAGDAWEDDVKPFRTVEDVHVHAAVLGHAIALARRAAAPWSIVERLAALAIAVRALAERDPKAATTHVALAGALSDARALLAELEPSIAALGAEAAARWTRDRPLLEVASKARAARAERARERLARG